MSLPIHCEQAQDAEDTGFSCPVCLEKAGCWHRSFAAVWCAWRTLQYMNDRSHLRPCACRQSCWRVWICASSEIQTFWKGTVATRKNRLTQLASILGLNIRTCNHSFEFIWNILLKHELWIHLSFDSFVSSGGQNGWIHSTWLRSSLLPGPQEVRHRSDDLIRIWQTKQPFLWIDYVI